MPLANSLAIGFAIGFVTASPVGPSGPLCLHGVFNAPRMEFFFGKLGAGFRAGVKRL